MNQVATTIRIDSKLNFTHEIALRNSKAVIKLSVNRLLSSHIVVLFFFHANVWLPQVFVAIMILSIPLSRQGLYSYVGSFSS